MASRKFTNLLQFPVLLLLVGFSLASCDSTSKETSKNSIEQIKNVDGYSYYVAFDWSPDGKEYIRSVYDDSDKRLHLCIYDSATNAKIKCIIKIHPDQQLYRVGIPEYFVRNIEWKDGKLFIEETFSNTSFIYWLSIKDWRTREFMEVDGGNEKNMKLVENSGQWPAWDPITRKLYFQGLEERPGIIEEHNGNQKAINENGVLPFVAGKHLWYSQYSSNKTKSVISGIVKRNLLTGEEEQITNGNDIGVSVSDSGSILFIRESNASGVGNGRLYYVNKEKGIKKIVYGSELGPDSKIVMAKISPNGDRALALIAKETREKIEFLGQPSYINLGVTRYKLIDISIKTE